MNTYELPQALRLHLSFAVIVIVDMYIERKHLPLTYQNHYEELHAGLSTLFSLEQTKYSLMETFRENLMRFGLNPELPASIISLGRTMEPTMMPSITIASENYADSESANAKTAAVFICITAIVLAVFVFVVDYHGLRCGLTEGEGELGTDKDKDRDKEAASHPDIDMGTLYGGEAGQSGEMEFFGNIMRTNPNPNVSIH